MKPVNTTQQKVSGFLFFHLTPIRARYPYNTGIFVI
jgi:hypothetical protein